jgi:carbon-monoxide dehydrogenase small subunit
VDGVLVNSCLVPILQADGTNIITIEGLTEARELHHLQQAFLECGGSQCGICTPGIIMAACYLLSKKPQPKSEDIREGLSGNLCRCTGYAQICEAVSEAAAVDNAKRKNATGVND